MFFSWLFWGSGFGEKYHKGKAAFSLYHVSRVCNINMIYWNWSPDWGRIIRLLYCKSSHLSSPRLFPHSLLVITVITFSNHLIRKITSYHKLRFFHICSLVFFPALLRYNYQLKILYIWRVQCVDWHMYTLYNDCHIKLISTFITQLLWGGGEWGHLRSTLLTNFSSVINHYLL
jgi:hypothetical protein